MKTIHWSSLCSPDDFLHIASIEFFGPAASARHDHDFYECFLVTSGSGRHWTPDGRAPLRDKHLYFVRPEHAHALEDSEKLAVLNIAVAAPVVATCLPLLELPAGCWTDGDPIRELALNERQARELVAAASDAAGRPGRAVAAGLLFDLSRLLVRPGTRDVDPVPWPDWFAQALPECTDPATITEGLSALSRKMGRSPEHISRTFRACLGQTPTEWLNQERIRHACRLLATTRMSVLDIALDCGFESPSYFHKSFRAATGTTPRNYRTDRRRVHPVG